MGERKNTLASRTHEELLKKRELVLVWLSQWVYHVPYPCPVYGLEDSLWRKKN